MVLYRFPYYLNGELIRIEHYGMAHYHGTVAAKNMVGQRVPATSVPFFWTTQVITLKQKQKDRMMDIRGELFLSIYR